MSSTTTLSHIQPLTQNNMSTHNTTHPNNAQLLQQLNQLQQTVFTLTQQLNQLTTAMSNSYTVNIHTCCLHGSNCPNNQQVPTTNNTTDDYHVNTNDEYTQYLRNKMEPRIEKMSKEFIKLMQTQNATEYVDTVRNMNLNDTDDNKESKADSNINTQCTNEFITVYLDNTATELTDQGKLAVKVVFTALDRNKKQYLTMNELSCALYDVLRRDYRGENEDELWWIIQSAIDPDEIEVGENLHITEQHLATMYCQEYESWNLAADYQKCKKSG